MWFAVRDMLFGKDAYPPTEVPETLSRPEMGRLMPQIPEEYEDCILLLMNVLMIEVRAENFFSFCTAVMRDPDNFRDRRAAARCMPPNSLTASARTKPRMWDIWRPSSPNCAASRSRRSTADASRARR